MVDKEPVLLKVEKILEETVVDGWTERKVLVSWKDPDTGKIMVDIMDQKFYTIYLDDLESLEDLEEQKNND